MREPTGWQSQTSGCCIRALGTAMAMLVVMLAQSGCSATWGTVNTALGKVQLWSARSGDGTAKAGTAAFRRQVENDPFPTAAEAGL